MPGRFLKACRLTVLRLAMYWCETSPRPAIEAPCTALQASSGSDIYKMEEQLITIITSNALINVLGSSGLQFSGIEILAVEPASITDVPGWWTEKVVLDSDSSLIAQAPDLNSSLAPTASSKACYIKLKGIFHAPCASWEGRCRASKRMPGKLLPLSRSKARLQMS